MDWTELRSLADKHGRVTRDAVFRNRAGLHFALVGFAINCTERDDVQMVLYTPIVADTVSSLFTRTAANFIKEFDYLGAEASTDFIQEEFRKSESREAA